MYVSPLELFNGKLPQYVLYIIKTISNVSSKYQYFHFLRNVLFSGEKIEFNSIHCVSLQTGDIFDKPMMPRLALLLL